MTTYNHDAAAELAEAESIVREWLPFSRDGEAICRVMVEYDRRAAELAQLRRERAAVLALHPCEGGICGRCSNDDAGWDEPWPCPTVTALGVEA
jgi:hypothetical protein